MRPSNRADRPDAPPGVARPDTAPPDATPRDAGQAPEHHPAQSDLETVMRAGDREALPESLPSFRGPLIAGVIAVAVSAGIALFWPVSRPEPMRLCGDRVQSASMSCVVHHQGEPPGGTTPG